MMYLTVFILIFGACSCELDEQEKYFSYDVVGSDYAVAKEVLHRPCSFNDFPCMRKFLLTNSKCTPAPGYRPDPLYLPIERFFFPVSTMTATHINVRVRGLKNAKVREFAINKATGNVIITISIPTYNLTSSAYFMYQRTAREPIILSAPLTFEVDNIYITAVIPKVPKLRLDLANIHADTHNALPRVQLSPKLFTSSDPTVKYEFSLFTKNMVTVVKEVFLFHSYLLMTRFIQDMLCNFGLDSYRNYDGFFLGKCHPQTVKY